MTRIKVSGITKPEDAEKAARLGADIVSVVFWAQSPRYVSVTQAWQIASALPASVSLAGIFIDTPVPIVRHIAAQTRLDMIQLFGDEPKETVEAAGPTAFKAVTVADQEQLATALREYGSRRNRSDGIPGIMIHLSGGVSSEWSALQMEADRGPLLLAADGLDAETAMAAVSSVRPWGIDVWEAVETEPGSLNPDRLARLVEAVREADAAAD